jgi:hypothetical protein
VRSSIAVRSPGLLSLKLRSGWAVVTYFLPEASKAAVFKEAKGFLHMGFKKGKKGPDRIFNQLVFMHCVINLN